MDKFLNRNTVERAVDGNKRDGNGCVNECKLEAFEEHGYHFPVIQ